MVQYLEDLLDIELSDYVEVAEGRVTIKEGEEDEAIIKIKVLEEYEETVLKLLEENSDEEDIKSDTYAAEILNTFSERFESNNWQHVYTCFLFGKYAKTRLIFIFVAYDEEGMYVYFWG